MKTAALAEVCDVITDGTHYTPRDIRHGIPFLTVKDVGPNGLDFDGCAKISNPDFEKANAGLSAPKRGDVLFSKDGTVGKVHVVETDERFAVLSSLAILRPAKTMDSRFLGHMLGTPDVLAQATRRKSGSAIRRIILSDLKKVEIPWPPLLEQQRIAAILDLGDALRTKRRQVLAHLDSLTQSIFHDMFGAPTSWPSARLDELTDKRDRINYGVIQPGDNAVSGVPLVRVSDLIDGRIDRSNLKRISPEVERAYGRSRLRGTEILVSCVGSIGAISLVGPQDIGSNIARAISRIPITDDVLREYVASYLRTPTPQRYFRREVRTVAQPTLNVRQLAATRIPLPPARLQAEFVRQLRDVSRAASTADNLVVADDELFASLQSRAFRGEL